MSCYQVSDKQLHIDGYDEALGGNRMNKVIVCTDFENTSSIRTGILISQNELTSDIKFDNEVVACFYNYAIYPIKYFDELVEVVTYRQQLKKTFDDSIKLVYKLRNKISTGG